MASSSKALAVAGRRSVVRRLRALLLTKSRSTVTRSGVGSSRSTSPISTPSGATETAPSSKSGPFRATTAIRP